MANLSILETEAKSRGFSDLTLKAYIRHNNEFLKFIKKNPEEILQDDIKNYVNHLVNEKKLKTSSLSLVLCALKFYYGGLLKKQIFNDITLQKNEIRISASLTKEEVGKLINSISNPKHKLLVSFMYASGLRVSEVIKLKTSDLNFKEGIGKVVIGSREKNFILSKSIANELNEYLSNRNKESEFLFPTKYGHLSIRMAQKIVNKSSKKAKMGKNVYSNLLRSSYASHLIENGADKNLIKMLLGTKRYTKVTKEKLKKIISPLDITDLSKQKILKN